MLKYLKMRKIIEIRQPEPAFYLTWVLNNICTNACDYCPKNLHSGTNHNYDWSHAKRFTEIILEKYPRINIAISGGEPTLSPWFKDLVTMYSSRGHSVGMTTNGARSVRYYSEIAPHMSYIVMSYHPSFEDPLLIEKALACAEHTSTTVSVMMDSRFFDKSLEMFNRIAENCPTLSIEPIRIHDWGVGHSLGRTYTTEQEEILNNLPRVNATIRNRPKIPSPPNSFAVYIDGAIEPFNAQKLINDNNTNFRDWECNIGLDSLYVKYDGIIRLGNCIGSKTIGRLQDIDNIEWPTKSFICPQNFCNCTTDVYIPKKQI